MWLELFLDELGETAVSSRLEVVILGRLILVVGLLAEGDGRWVEGCRVDEALHGLHVGGAGDGVRWTGWLLDHSVAGLVPLSSLELRWRVL